ncbi:MAG: hypothetical protein KDK62_05390 [Chlamydiia bacterium]|nr:hypothetical protein [Chlamydiia bacterium]
MPDNTGLKQDSGKFRKGVSGNPNGRPKGSKNKSTLAAEQFLEASLVGICQRIEDEALDGNMQAAKMILERFVPPRKDRPIQLDIPVIKTYQDILTASQLILSAVFKGEISPSEGESLSRAIESYSKALEACDIELRLQSLEDIVRAGELK